MRLIGKKGNLADKGLKIKACNLISADDVDEFIQHQMMIVTAMAASDSFLRT